MAKKRRNKRRGKQRLYAKRQLLIPKLKELKNANSYRRRDKMSSPADRRKNNITKSRYKKKRTLFSNRNKYSLRERDPNIHVGGYDPTLARRIKVCNRRKTRRTFLFKTGLLGRGGYGPKRKRLSLDSQIKC